jgi:hypothetical protein
MKELQNSDGAVNAGYKSRLSSVSIHSWGKLQANTTLKTFKDPYILTHDSKLSQDKKILDEVEIIRPSKINKNSFLFQHGFLEDSLSPVYVKQNVSSIGFVVSFTTSNPLFISIYRNLYNFKKKLFDFSDDELLAQYELQEKITALDAELIRKAADPKVSTEAIIALRHLALAYRRRQSGLLKKRSWFTNLVSLSISLKSIDQHFSIEARQKQIENK